MTIFLTNRNTRATLCGHHASAQTACDKYNADGFYTAQGKAAAVEDDKIIIRQHGEVVDTYGIVAGATSLPESEAPNNYRGNAERAWEAEDEEAWYRLSRR